MSEQPEHRRDPSWRCTKLDPFTARDHRDGIGTYRRCPACEADEVHLEMMIGSSLLTAEVERLEAKVEEFHRWGSDSPDEIADHLESIGLGENARTIRRLTSIAEAAAEYVETQTVCETCASLRRLRWLLEEMP